MPADYKATLTLEDEFGGKRTMYGMLSDEPAPPQYAVDFTANFRCREHGYVMNTQQDWDDCFAQGLGQDVTVFCLEQSTNVTTRQFTIMDDYMSVFMPKGSFGMDHRSVNIRLGKCNGPVNVSFGWMCEDPGTNLWVNGGGKWGPAIQYGPIQSGSIGGIRFMPTWAAGASTLGKQDLTCSIQNQPNGGQWLQPPYYGYRPISYNHWYNIRLRMTGGSGQTPQTVHCQYWKDDDPVMSYDAATDNFNAQEGLADVMIDWTCFFGGTAQNCAPADCSFNFRDLRVWVEA